MRMLLLAAATVAVSGTVPAAATDPVDLARPSVRIYTERDGLPQGTIHAIAFDREGFLWIGTQDGAARFNGRTFTRVDMPSRAVSNYVRAVLPARDGSLWFGREEGGAVRLNGGAATVFDRAEGLPASRVNDLVETRDGGIWVATNGGGVARLAGAGFVPVTDGLPDLRVWKLLERRDDAGRRTLLAGCEGGLAELADGKRWAPLDLGTSLAGFSVNSLLETGDGASRTLWVGTFGAGLFRVAGGRVTRFGPSGGLASRLVTSVAATTGADGNPAVWVGTRDAGVFRLAGDAFEHVALGESANEVYTLRGGAGADAGTLWVGTRLAGLARVLDAPWVTFDRATGLPGEQAFCFLAAKGPLGLDAVWIGTSAGIAVVEGGRVSSPGPASGLPASPVRSIVALPTAGGRQEVWASLIGAGLWKLDGTRWTPVEARPAFRSDDAGVLAVGEDEAGRPALWVGTEKSGLGRLSGGRWSVLGVADGLPSASVLSLLPTRGSAGRTLWVGTRGGGLAEVVAGRVVAVHDRRTGLPNNNVLSLAEVRGSDGRKELWVGTRGGVTWRDLDAPGAAWSVLSEETRPALPNSAVALVAQDAAGAVYLGTNRGVARLTRPRTGPPEVVVFGRNEGLPSASCNWGSLVDGRGRVWVSTAAGAAVLEDTRLGAGRREPHPLVVERVEVGGVVRPRAGVLNLRPGEREVAFEYSLLAFHGAALIRYRTQLAGWEDAPTAWVEPHRREFTNVPPGSYVFRVWGRDAEGVESGPAEVRLEVARSWWKTPAALVLWALLLVLSVVAATRVHEGALRRRAEELEALVRLRTRELSDARDAAEAATESKGRFLAHMSHEVRTPLNAILGYSEMLAEDLRERGAEDLLVDLEKIRRAATQQLALVSEALDLGKIDAGKVELHLTEFDAERLVRETVETAWPLVKKGHNRLESSGLESLGTLFSDQGKLRQVLLNLLSNAARFTERGAVAVEAGRDGETVVIRVRDTGIGMTPDQLARVFTPYAQADAGTSARYGGTGLGLAISRGYCELMKGSLDAESEPGRGTTFTVRLPARLERRGEAR